MALINKRISPGFRLEFNTFALTFKSKSWQSPFVNTSPGLYISERWVTAIYEKVIKLQDRLDQILQFCNPSPYDWGYNHILYRQLIVKLSAFNL